MASAWEPRAADQPVPWAVPRGGVPAAPRPERPDPATGEEFPRRPGGLWADILLWVDLGVLGVLALIVAIVGVATIARGGPAVAEDVDVGAQRAYLVVSSLVLVATMGAVPLLWALVTRRTPAEGFRFLRLRGNGVDVALGLAALVCMFLLVAAVSLVLTRFEGTKDLTDNPELEAMRAVLTLPLAFLLAASAAIGEEILFRGYLMRRIGLWPQAILFGLSHLGYGTVLQVVLPFAVGIGFGYLVRWRDSLWAAIVAHFLFDFLMALLLMHAPEDAAAQRTWLPWPA